jgi:hypothetical protein
MNTLAAIVAEISGTAGGEMGALHNTMWEFVGLGSTADTTVLLEHFLREKKFDATEALVTYLKQAKDDYGLYSISICIREGANVNAYVNLGDKRMHIGCYLYHESPPDLYLDVTFSMLVAAGLSMDSPSYAENQTVFRPKNSSSFYGVRETVHHWLVNKGLYKQANFNSNNPGDNKRIIGLLTGRLDLVGAPRSLAFEESITVSRSRADSQQYSNNIETIDLLDWMDLTYQKPYETQVIVIDPILLAESVYSLDASLAKRYAQRRIFPSYALTNFIISEISTFSHVHHLKSVIVDILHSFIRSGLKLDIYQFNLLKQKLHDDLETYQSLENAYFSVKHKHSESSTEKEIISLIHEGVSTEKLVQALIDRSAAYFVVKYASLGDYVLNKHPPPLHSDKFQYTTTHVVFFKNARGFVECITSPHFEETLARTDISPRTRNEIMEKMVFSVGIPMKWEDYVKQIVNSHSRVSNLDSDAELIKMLKSLSLKAVPEAKILSLTPDDIRIIFDSLGIGYGAAGLTREHAITTLAYVYNKYSATNSNFESIVRNYINSR